MIILVIRKNEITEKNIDIIWKLIIYIQDNKIIQITMKLIYMLVEIYLILNSALKNVYMNK